MDRQVVVQLIIDAVEAYRESPGPEQENAVDPSARLFGRNGLLDSLGLVNVVLEVEQEVSDRAGVAISLMDERAMSQSRSPFRTVETLADYVTAALAERQGA